MAGKIFISYRRADDASMAARIKQALSQRFGEETIFLDVENLEPGERFDAQLQNKLSESSVLIVLIGSRWAEILMQKLSQDKETDYVISEIDFGLKNNLSIIPVRIGMEQAIPSMPNKSILPESISSFSMYQSVTVTHEKFLTDLSHLEQKIIDLRPQDFRYSRFKHGLRRNRLVVAAFALSIVLSLGVFSMVKPLGPSPLEVSGMTTFDVNVVNRSLNKIKIYSARYGACDFFPWAVEFDRARSYHSLMPAGREREWDDRVKRKISDITLEPGERYGITYRRSGYDPNPCGVQNGTLSRTIEISTSEGKLNLAIPSQ